MEKINFEKWCDKIVASFGGVLFSPTSDRRYIEIDGSMFAKIYKFSDLWVCAFNNGSVLSSNLISGLDYYEFFNGGKMTSEWGCTNYCIDKLKSLMN